MSGGSKAQKKLDELLELWKNSWGVPNKTKDEFFYKLFIETYQEVTRKAIIYKDKNFKWKKGFLWILTVGFIVYIILILLNRFFQDQTIAVFVENGLLLVLFFILAWIASKWISVKKYQETWARYSMHRYMLNREMLLFITHMKPYDGGDARDVFIKNIIKIWEKNEKQFVYNLMNKEKELFDYSVKK